MKWKTYNGSVKCLEILSAWSIVWWKQCVFYCNVEINNKLVGKEVELPVVVFGILKNSFNRFVLSFIHPFFYLVYWINYDHYHIYVLSLGNVNG